MTQFPNRRTVFLATVAAALCGSGLHAAALLSATPASVAVTCNTLTGPGSPAVVVVKPIATLTSGAIAVALVSPGTGLVVTPPSSAILTSANQSQGLAFSFNLAHGCAGASGSSTTVRFTAAGLADVSVTVMMTVTAAASALVASPVALTCVRNAGPPVTYSPGPPQTVSVTSMAAGGTPFSVDTSANPAWLTVTPATGGIAGPAGIPLTVSVPSCGNYLPGSSNTASIHLRNPPAPDALIPVTLRILGPSPVIATPAAPALSYIKGSGTPALVDVALAASSTSAFALDSASLPPWLSVDAVSGVVPQTLRFTTTSMAESMVQGSYAAAVRVQVAGFADLSLPIRLNVGNPAPTLTVAEGTTRDISWTVGQPLPALYLTLASSDSAIPYSIATCGALAPIVSSSLLKGFAYSSGTPIPVTFEPGVFATAQPGTVLSGTVTVSWGAPASKTLIAINVAIKSAGAVLLGVSPSVLPTAAAGEAFTVALVGTGFVTGPDLAQRTVVGVVSGGLLVPDANISSTVVNPSNIILTITVPAAADPLLPFAVSGPGGPVTLGVCNPSGAACNSPTGTVQITIGPNPVIQAVTSASAFVQVPPPNLPVVAPYDIISLFGINFCTGNGTGCGDSILYGALDPATLRYPIALSPDPSGSPQRFLTVGFHTHAKPPVPIANAPLFFATNGQINLLTPSGLSPFIGKQVDIVVSFGFPDSDVLSSAPFTVNVVAANPGIFTVGGDGQGEGAILGQDGAMVTRGNEAGMRQNPADSDFVQIYATGLGVPDGTADNAAVGGGLWPADCISAGSYLASLNLLTSGSATNLDGVWIAGGLLNTGRLAPCLRYPAAVPLVTIGGQPATVLYAGWAPDSVVGQYQINARLPGFAAAPFTSAVQLPVTISARGRTSQPGVTIWVAPRLKVTGPVGAALRGTLGVPWSAMVAASGGTAPYRYAVSAGSLPAGMNLNDATGAISGTPSTDAAGSYTVTVTATDSAAKPLTGSATFTLTAGPRS